MGWKIVEIENADRALLFLDNIVIYKENEKITIPINDIDVLLLNNYKLALTVQLLNKLSENNIVVIICNNKHLPSSLIIPLFGNYNTLKIMEKQIKWSHSFKSNSWIQIIKNKIQNQIDFMKYLDVHIENVEVLERLKLEVKDYDVTNREGHASKVYWHSIMGSSFKRHNDDYINGLLNYGYSILRAFFARSIVKKGLDPRIAFFHKSFHNHFSLASDLMEPFRILVDYVVYQFQITGEINFYKHKEIITEAFSKKILVNNQNYYVNNAIDIFVDYVVKEDNLPIISMKYDRES